MSIISVGTINKKILFAVFAGIFKLVGNIILHHSTVNMNSHPCIIGVNSTMGMCLSFFPFLYLYLKNRKIKIKTDLNKKPTVNDGILIYNNAKDDAQKRKHIYILVISLFDCIQKISTVFFLHHILENFWIFDSLLLLIFSFLILKTKFYVHHFLSLIMIIIVGIILVAINYYDKDITFFKVFITLLTETFYCLENVVCKFVMEIKFCSPYEVCFKIGFLELLLFIILLIIFTKVPIRAIDIVNKYSDEYVDNYSEYIERMDLEEKLLFILLLFLRCVFILFGFIITDYFTPAHIVLILIISEISFLFIDDNNWKLYIKIFFFIILIFFILVFVEIIELNIFGLQKNTKRNIIKRAENDDSDYNINYKDNFDREVKNINDIEMDSQRSSITEGNEIIN